MTSKWTTSRRLSTGWLRTATAWSAAPVNTRTSGAWPTCAGRRESSWPSPSESTDPALGRSRFRPLRSYDGRSMSSRVVSGGVVHTVPVDLRRVLIAAPKALAAWEGLTPLARNEWICWVLWPKKAETRSQHIQRLRSELLGGKRRPCCWLGCTHRKDKERSPSVRWGLRGRGKTSA